MGNMIGQGTRIPMIVNEYGVWTRYVWTMRINFEANMAKFKDMIRENRKITKKSNKRETLFK
jgi:ligand-binding SRPBCC domain-containing protein